MRVGGGTEKWGEGGGQAGSRGGSLKKEGRLESPYELCSMG